MSLLSLSHVTLTSPSQATLHSIVTLSPSITRVSFRCLVKVGGLGAGTAAGDCGGVVLGGPPEMVLKISCRT